MSGTYGPRIAALAAHLSKNEISAFIAWRPVALGYLHGLFEAGHERFLALFVSRNGDVRLICPALTAIQAARVGIQDIRPWKDGEDPIAHYHALVSDWGLEKGIVAVDPDLPAHMLLSMQRANPDCSFVDGRSLLSSLTSVKSPEEIELMRKAARIADDAWLEVPRILKAGKTERQVAEEIAAEMKKRGGTPTFCIVAAGPNAAESHHLSDDTVINDGDVVILDFGCDYEGYQSDITRTVACGRASDEAKTVYEIVYGGFMAGRQHAKVGATGESVDRAARKVIADAGYGVYFVHRTGHGIGMEGHEEPNMVEGNVLPLEKGNCFSVEPGIYLAGKFGVRIENIVTVDETGCVSLNDEPSPTLLSF